MLVKNLELYIICLQDSLRLALEDYKIIDQSSQCNFRGLHPLDQST